MKFATLLSAAPALALSESLRRVERKLDTLDIVNDFLSDLTFEIVVGTGFAGITVEDVFCEDFSLDGLTITATLDDSSSPEENSLVISGTGLDFSCDVLVDYGFFGSQTINIPSDGSQFNVPLNFFSDEFGRIIPTTVEVDPTAECIGDIVILNLNLGILGFVDVEGIIGDELCPTLETTLADLVATINDLGLDEIAGTRAAQVASVPAEMTAAEAAVAAILPVGFTLYDDVAFETFTAALLTEVLGSPLVQSVAGLAFQLIDAYEADDIDAAVGFLEDIIFVVTEQVVEIPDDVVDAVVDSGVIDLILDGGSLVDIAAAIVEIIGVELPTAEEVAAIFDALPESIATLLEPVETFILDVIAASSSTARRLQSLDDILAYTVQDVIDLIDFEVAGLELEAFLLSFGATTPIVDVLTELGTLLEDIVADLTTIFDTGFSLSDPLPDSFLTLLELASILVPDTVGDIYDTIVAGGGSLSGFSDLFSLEVALEGFGTFGVTLDSLLVSIGFAIDTTTAGLVETSSFVFPEIDLSSFSLTVGVLVDGTDEGGAAFVSDEVSINLDLSVFNQVGVTAGFDFTSLGSFDGSGITSAITAGPILLDYLTCAFGSVGVSVSAQRTVSDVSGTFTSVDGGLDGLFADAIQIFADMYLPALPTILENTASGLVDPLTFFSYDGVCA